MSSSSLESFFDTVRDAGPPLRLISGYKTSNSPAWPPQSARSASHPRRAESSHSSGAHMQTLNHKRYQTIRMYQTREMEDKQKIMTRLTPFGVHLEPQLSMQLQSVSAWLRVERERLTDRERETDMRSSDPLLGSMDSWFELKMCWIMGQKWKIAKRNRAQLRGYSHTE